MDPYQRPPRLPQKPASYSQGNGGAVTMNELLSTLSLEELPPQQRRQSRIEDQARPDVMQHRGSNGSLAAQSGHATYSTYPGSLSHHGDHTYGGIRDTMFEQQALLSGIDGRSHASSVLPAGSQARPQVNETKWPTRKPVEAAPARRTYYSPDDLDDLVRGSASKSVSEQQPFSRPSPAAPLGQSGPQYGVQNSYEDYSARNRYSSYAGQVPHADNYRPDLVPTPAIPDGPLITRPLQQFPSRNPQNMYTPSSYASPEHGGRDVGEDYRFGGGPLHDPPPFAPRQEFQYLPSAAQLRMPSPPARPDSTASQGLSRRSTTPLDMHPTLVPVSHAYQNPSYDASFSPPSRQNSEPLRSMSSMSSSPQRSPERQQRHPISELEASYGGRIPSPDRSQQFPDAEYEVEGRSGTESVPPQIQARRGRPKGEVVLEGDLPAMPPLFPTQEDHRPLSSMSHSATSLPQPLRSPLRTGSALSIESRASVSPSRPGTAVNPRPPRKRESFGREPDVLQSIKTLPVRPIKCPPLCLEERFHPSTFAKTNKFKIKVHPGCTPFVAGGEIFGHIDICSDEGFRAQLGSTQVLVGEIGVEVIGYEEIQHSESGHYPRSLTFLYGRKVFQTIADTHPIRSQEEHLLTSAVLNNPLPDRDGYRAASKGTTSFPFAFPLPIDCPSSADIHVARIRYVVTGYATVKLQGSQEIIATSQSVRVVEAWDIGNPVYTEPIEANAGRDIANYQEIAAMASIGKSLYIEGEVIQGNIKVVNHSHRRVREVKFSLVNKVTFFGDLRSAARDLNPSQDFSLEEGVAGHSEPHAISSGGQEEWIFAMQIPVDRCISIRNSALFEVSPCILVKISTGPLQKATKLYIPSISIANQNSMVDNQERKAPTSEVIRWSNLPQLYRLQRVIEGIPQPAEKGTQDLTPLIKYIDAHERVSLLSDG